MRNDKMAPALAPITTVIVPTSTPGPNPNARSKTKPAPMVNSAPGMNSTVDEGRCCEFTKDVNPIPHNDPRVSYQWQQTLRE